ncbi:MAG: hypothetical protein J6U54_17295 [Clostridiales bacterium]|nr:hypothetical protein [Clostridiales bacterium]
MKTILFAIVALYFLIGILCWYGGIKTFGGRKNYILYITKEKEKEKVHLPFNNVIVAYYLALIMFIFTWPIFIRRHDNE